MIFSLNSNHFFLLDPNLYGQIGEIIPENRLPYEDDGVTLSWTLSGYDGEIPYAEETIDVTQPPYNAVGDGVTDNTQAIRDAINDADDDILSEIYFPPGIYKIEGTIGLVQDAHNNIILKGDLSDIAELKFDIGDNAENDCIVISGRNNVGIEDLKITRADSSYEVSGTTIQFSNSNNCWIMGVESSRAFSTTIGIHNSEHIEVSGCYLHHPQNVCGGGFGYGVSTGSESSYCLIENNIFSYFRHSMVLSNGPYRNVFGYNYSRKPRQSDYPDLGKDFTADICLHGHPSQGYAGPKYNLFEGNNVAQIKVDHVHEGNGPYNTFFRNKAGIYGIWIEGSWTGYHGNRIQTFVNTYAKCLNWFYSNWFRMPRRLPASKTYEKNTLVQKVNILGVLYEEVWSDRVDSLEYPSVWEEPNFSYYYPEEPSFITDISDWPFHPKNNSSNPAKMRWDYGLRATVSRDCPQGEIVIIKWENNQTINTDLTIPFETCLEISPGVTVNFAKNTKLIIEGAIIAEGTDHDIGEILFTEEDPGEGWGGIFFDRFPNMYDELGSSKFEYCKFEHAYYFTPEPREGREDDGGSAISATYYSDIIIDNCIFENNTSWSGGGAIFLNHSDITIKNSIFQNNTSLEVGGAIGSLCSSPEIINNIITNNTAGLGDKYGNGEGGGLYFQSSNEREIILIGNVICNNFVDGDGGGISIIAIDEWTGYKLITLNNTISNNNATWRGGAVYTWYSDDKFINNIFWGNTADYGTQFFIYHPGYSYIDFYHCDIEGGIDGGIEVYGTLSGEYVNNIDVYPMFIDPTNGDFRLENGSECIDAGLGIDSGYPYFNFLPITDPSGNPRIAGEIIDIGAYEYYFPGIYIEGMELGFGELINRDTSRDTIVIKNNGTIDLTLFPDNFAIPDGFEVSCESTLIPANGGTTNVFVDFIPEKFFEEYVDTLVIVCSDQFFPRLSFLLTGIKLPAEYEEVSGYIDNNETWEGYILITGNVTISNDATLTIAENSEVYNVEGYQLSLESGNIIMNDSKLYLRNSSEIDINGTITLSGGSLIEVASDSEFRLEPGSSLYGTDHTVYEDPVTGQRYETWEEAYTANPEIGAEDAIPGDRIIVNNSSFNAIGDSTNRITISSVGSDYFWDGIELNDNSPSHFNYCDVSNLNFIKVNFSGLLFENSTFSNGSQIIAKNNSGLNIDNSTFDNLNACPIVSYESINLINNCTITNNNGNGISIFYPSSQCGNISGNTIKYNEYWGISYYDTHIQSFNNDISENISHGVVAQGSMGSAVLAGNIIENNGGAEIIGDRRCYPNLTSFIGIYGPNTIYDEYDPDGYNYLDQYLLMCGRYDEIPIDVRDNIFPNENDIDFEDRFHPFYDAYIFDGEKPPEKVLYDQGISLINNNEFEPAKLTMKDIVNNYPDTGTAENALQLLMYLEKFSGKDYATLRSYIENIDSELYSHLERTKYNTITSTYMAEKDYYTAITRLEDVLANPPSFADSIFAYIDEGYCYLRLDEQGSKSLPIECCFKPKCFEEFSYVSQNLLDNAIHTSEPPTTDPQTVEFALNQSYPNPASLYTTFSFSIPANTKNAELKIYNIRGQLVKTFIPESNEKGITDNFKWDCKDENGRTLCNGIYLYKLSADKKEIVKKMVLLR